MPEFLLGVDCGLTVTKAVVFERDGRARGSGLVLAVNDHPRPGWVEKDPGEQWRGCAVAIRTALADAGVQARDIAAVGLTGHGDGAYFLDAAGRPARPAIPSLDTRAKPIVEQWRRSGRAAAALELTGEEPYAQQAPPMLAWLRANRPDDYARTAAVVFAKDWIKLQMTGRLSTDRTEASAGFTELWSQGYDPRVGQVYGLDGIEARLPDIDDPLALAGEVTPAAAELTGLAAGTPVGVGLHDVDAAALGSGLLGPGELMVVAGTYSVNEVVTERPAVDPRWYCRNWVTAGRWLVMSTSPTSATNLEWVVRTLFPREVAEAQAAGRSPYAFVSDEVAAASPSASPLLYCPFLYGSQLTEEASGAFVGLRPWHQRGHVLRAVLEGVVLNHRWHADVLRSAFHVDGARLCGGGAASDVWSQMFADALDLPVRIAASQQAGALGAALCAGVGAGVYAGLEQAVAQATAVRRTCRPEGAGREALARAYGRFQRLCDALAPVWHELWEAQADAG